MKRKIIAPFALLLGVVLFSFLMKGYAAEGGGSLQKLWEWKQPGIELYDLTFSSDENEISFVKKIHEVDGHEAEMVSEDERVKGRERIKKDKRACDPEIVISSLKNSSLETIDWGWAPEFFPGGRKIVYARQEKPLSGHRFLAESFKGNPLMIFDRNQKKSSILVKPNTGYFGDPRVLQDGSAVVFSCNDAVNGAWGGTTGLGKIDLKSKQVSFPLPPKKDHNLFHLVEDWDVLDGSIYAIRRRPLMGGMYMADSYRCELMQVTSTVAVFADWGEAAFLEVMPAFRKMSDGTLVVFDKEWKDLKGNKMSLPVSKERVYPPQWTSPRGDYFIQFAVNEIILRTKKGESIGKWRFQGKIQTLVWSQSSSKLGIILTHSKYPDDSIFDYDQIVVLGLNRE